MSHARNADELLEVLGDELWSVIGNDPRSNTRVPLFGPFLLVKSKKEPWTEEKLRRSSLLIAFLNLFELVVAFAAMYWVSHSAVQNVYSANPRQAFYFSLVTTTTVGYGDFIPTTGVGRRLAALQLTTVILFLTFVLPALVSTFSPQLYKGVKDSSRQNADS